MNVFVTWAYLVVTYFVIGSTCQCRPHVYDCPFLPEVEDYANTSPPPTADPVQTEVERPNLAASPFV